MLCIGPGDTAFNRPFEEWLPLAGSFVDIDKAQERPVIPVEPN
jgi:hypothetical protein